MTRGERQVEKDLRDSRDLGVQSFNRTPLALRRARVDNAIEAAIRSGLLVTANKETLTESSSAHEQGQDGRVYQRVRKQASKQIKRKKVGVTKIDGRVLKKIIGAVLREPIDKQCGNSSEESGHALPPPVPPLCGFWC